MFRRERTRRHSPAPIAAQGTWLIHPRLGSQAEHILHGDDRRSCDRGKKSADETPIHLRAVSVKISPRERFLLLNILQCPRAVAAFAVPPAHRRIVVVRAG